MKVHLKCFKGVSDKFWQVEVVGNMAEIRYGRNGNAGTLDTKSFSNDYAALNWAKGMVRHKLSKGYIDNYANQFIENRSSSSLSNRAAAQVAANSPLLTGDWAVEEDVIYCDT